MPMTINVTAIRGNGSPITHRFHVTGWDECKPVVNTVALWGANPTLGGIIRVFVNVKGGYKDGHTETMEFLDIKGACSYLQNDLMDDREGLAACWSVDELSGEAVELLAP